MIATPSPPSPTLDITDRVIDVRGLPPPEPMVRVLEATVSLAPGESLLMIHDRRPTLLYSRLAERGLQFETLEGPGELMRVIIRRPA